MKITTYKCDRCGAELDSDSSAVQRAQIATEVQVKHRLKFFGNWKENEPELIVYEMCEHCRQSFDSWLGMTSNWRESNDE